MKTKDSDELKKLRKTVREFLHAISRVPFRAVDCNQDKVEKLYNRLEKQSGLRW